MTDTLLVVDDEQSIRHAIKRSFPQYTVIEAETTAEALEKAQDGFPDLVLLDQYLPDGDGLELIKSLHAIDEELPVILMTGNGNVDMAVEALKQGASDFLEKPFQLEHLRANVELLLDRQRLGRQVAHLSGKGRSRVNLVAQSPAMKKVMNLVKRVAAVPSTTVLVQGESGVGKELIAQSIHERSARSSHRFIAINCAALSENLLEAELFGYEKGAFTGADSKGKIGLFEAAEGGTIFLDEIGEMPLTLQTKLLRVLQERCFRRVGGLDDHEVDVRIVAATNRDLRQEVAAGNFRQDLYYRLRVVPIQVPPLRERPEDILPIAENILKRVGADLNRAELNLGDDAKTAMNQYTWPGNVRELANAIERAVIVAIGPYITPEDLCMDEELITQASINGDQAQLPPGCLVLKAGERNLADVERKIIHAVLKETGGRKTQAAEMLGINRTTLYNKLREVEAVNGDQN